MQLELLHWESAKSESTANDDKTHKEGENRKRESGGADSGERKRVVRSRNLFTAEHLRRNGTEECSLFGLIFQERALVHVEESL